MKNNKKDNLEHRIMNYKRKSDQLEQRRRRGELNTKEWLDLEEELQHKFGVCAVGKDFVNFCKFLRLIGRSNHGKCNIKHDRNRKIVGNKKMVKNEKQKDFDKVNKKIQDED